MPTDVSVVGYDNIGLAAYSLPSLTTISQDLGKAGRVIVSKLLAASDGVPMQSERLPTELIFLWTRLSATNPDRIFRYSTSHAVCVPT